MRTLKLIAKHYQNHVPGRVMKGIDTAIGHVTTADLDFLTRVPEDSKEQVDTHADDGHPDSSTAKRTVSLEEIILIYPPSLGANKTELEIRTEFIDSLLRTKSKAQKDAIIATSLLPVAFGVDILLTLVWPFGGAAEADGVWAYSSLKGAKVARSVTKRLASSTKSGELAGESSTSTGSEDVVGGEKLKLTFKQSERVNVLSDYLAGQCQETNRQMFKRLSGGVPTETEVLEAIGWKPSGKAQDPNVVKTSTTGTNITNTTGTASTPTDVKSDSTPVVTASTTQYSPEMETHNWEDERWESEQVKEDLKATMRKAAKGWEKWIKMWEKDPEKAGKKN